MTGAERQTATGAALLEWVNSFPFPEDVASWGELSDGYKIWEILQDIDSSYFDGELPEGPSNSSGKWLLRWQNLKHLSKALVTYITEECDQTIPRGQGSIDIKSIAVDGNKGEIIKAGIKIRKRYN
ncbi:MAG: hypothetical protein MMC33_002630 [Icmadophila ericetorum]|nr:hypothetical protein [Icmadophila ericetorum]